MDVEIGGIKAKVMCRLFLRDGEISAVRSLRLFSLDDIPYRRVDSGKYENAAMMEADLEEQADG